MFRLKKGAAETLVPTATEGANGRFTINRGVHHKKCRLFTFNQLEAKDVDRFCRSEIGKNPTLNPMEFFEAGQREALKLSKKLAENSKNPDSIASLFPSWEEVRRQYFRRRANACLAIRNPFSPPQVFTETFRAFMTNQREVFYVKILYCCKIMLKVDYRN